MLNKKKQNINGVYASIDLLKEKQENKEKTHQQTNKSISAVMKLTK